MIFRNYFHDYALGEATFNKEGNIINVCVAQGSNSLLGKEAMRATKASPKWIPAQENSKMIEETFTIPVFFMIQ